MKEVHAVDQIARTQKQIGAILRRARKHANLSQSDLREGLSLRQGTISRLEAGKPVQLQTLIAALAALDLELVIRPRGKGSSAEIENLF